MMDADKERLSEVISYRVSGDTLISFPGELIKKCRFLNPTMSPDSTRVSGAGA